LNAWFLASALKIADAYMHALHVNKTFNTYRVRARLKKLANKVFFSGVVKTRNAGIWRNIREYGGISLNVAEYGGISGHFPGIYRNITIFSNGSHATVYKHGRLTTDILLQK
jgi:hypothetical protein